GAWGRERCCRVCPPSREGWCIFRSTPLSWMHREFENAGVREGKGRVTMTDQQEPDAQLDPSPSPPRTSANHPPRSRGARRGRKKPAIVRAHNPLTRETLPLIVYGEPLETEGDAP